MSMEADILTNYHVVAVVGLSPNEERPSNRVGRYLMEQGYKIIPVNPKESQILGQVSYPDLVSIPDKVQVVDIFRRSEEVPEIVEQAIRIGAKAVWMQEGVINEIAAERARRAGLLVVMDECMRKQHIKLKGGEERRPGITSTNSIGL